MTRSTLPMAAALTLATALALTACGGDDKASDTIPGVPTTAPTTPSAAPSTTAAEAGAPTFVLPPDIKVQLDGFDNADATKKAVLRDTGYAITAILEAESKVIVKETPNFKRYFTGLQGAQFADTIIQQARSGNIITGTYHYYQSSVKILGTGVASVAYCEDQRKGFDKVAKTGKVNTTTPSLNDFRLWTMTMSKNPSGDWQVLRYTWTLGSKKCQIV